MAFSGYIDEKISGGNISVVFSYGYNIIVIKKTYNLCEFVEENGLKCPLLRDMISLGFQVYIPSRLPPVSSTIIIKIIISHALWPSWAL